MSEIEQVEIIFLPILVPALKLRDVETVNSVSWTQEAVDEINSSLKKEQNPQSFYNSAESEEELPEDENGIVVTCPPLSLKAKRWREVTYDLNCALRDTLSESIQGHERVTINVRPLHSFNPKGELRRIVVNSCAYLRYMGVKKSAIRVEGIPPKLGMELLEYGDTIAEGILGAVQMTSATSEVKAKDPYSPASIPSQMKRQLDALHSYGVQSTLRNPEGFKQLGAFSGISAVARGSDNPPTILTGEVSFPAKQKNHLVLIGKGILYDAGGLIMKDEDGLLYDAAYDMAGSAVALGAFRYLAKHPELHNFSKVSLINFFAENITSRDSYRPYEIVKMQTGDEVLVTHTDAEGRLGIADSIIWARMNLEPDHIVDFATLTGDVVSATGNHMSGVFSDQDQLLFAAYKAGLESGDLVWPFPSGSHENISHLWTKIPKGRGGRDVLRQAQDEEVAEHIRAADFLRYFARKGYAPQNVNWLHVDLGSTSRQEEEYLGFVENSPTGAGVLWASEFLGRLET